LEMFYSERHNIIHLVPNRCGSSFTRDCCAINPGFISPLDEYLDSVSISVEYSAANPVNTIRKLRSADQRFNSATVYIVYRNPVYRYKSGLWMTASNLLTSEFLDAANSNELEVQREILNILLSMFSNMENQILPQWDFGDPHTTPVLVQSLMTYCCFPEVTKFVYLNDYADHLTELYGDAFNVPDHNKSDVAVPLHEEHFKRTITAALNKGPAPHYDFYDWLEPDQIVFDYLLDNKKINTLSANATLLRAINVDNAITRFVDIAATANSCKYYLSKEMVNQLKLQREKYADFVMYLLADRIAYH